jgi:hypothetical protein
MNGVTLRHLVVDGFSGDVACRLVLAQLPDAANVTLIVRERFGDKCVYKCDGFIDCVLTSTNGDNVGVIVLACEFSRGNTPDKCGTDALNLVRRHLLAIARASENDAERIYPGCLVARGCESSVDAEGGVIVERVVFLRTMIDDLVPSCAKVVLQVLTELKTGMIGRHMDSHTAILGRLG